MNVAVLVKLSNKKFMDKINPLLKSEVIEKIFIIRRFYGPNHPSIEYMKIPKLKLIKNESFRMGCLYIKGFFYLLKKKPQLIITYYFVPHGIFGIIYGKILRKRVISCIIGTDMNWFNKTIIGNLLRLLLSHSSVIISTGSNKKSELNKILSSYPRTNKVKVIPNTINVKKQVSTSILRRLNQFIFVGRLDKNKRIEIIIKSFHLFMKEVPEKTNFKLLIIGNGPLLKSMMLLVKKLNLTGNCKILGFQDKVSNYYNQSRYVVLASKSEGLPSVLLEGMNHGCIPITTDAGDIEDLINSSNGFLVSHKLSKEKLITSFYKKFIKVSHLNDEKLLEMSKNCIETTLNYNYEDGGRKWKNIIKSLD